MQERTSSHHTPRLGSEVGRTWRIAAGTKVGASLAVRLFGQRGYCTEQTRLQTKVLWSCGLGC